MRELTEAWPETADQRIDRARADTGTTRRPVLQHGAGKHPREISESRRDALQRIFYPVWFRSDVLYFTPQLSVLRFGATKTRRFLTDDTRQREPVFFSRARNARRL